MAIDRTPLAPSGQHDGSAETPDGIDRPWTARLAAGEVPRGGLRFHGCRVLLAEDNPVNQDVAVELLCAKGLIVDVAPDGVEAVALAGRQPYDLILMDVQMPRMDGLEATRAIRAGPVGHGTPIIAMTANAFEEDRQKCLAAGMNDHIAKPVQLRVLDAAIERWLGARLGAAAPDAAPLSARRAALENVPGLRIATGLGYVQGRFDRYEALLHRYLASAAADLAKLAVAEAGGDRPVMAAAAHSLRGAAAVVGATTVEAAAHAIEAVIRAAGSAEALALATAELRAAQAALAAAVHAAATAGA